SVEGTVAHRQRSVRAEDGAATTYQRDVARENRVADRERPIVPEGAAIVLGVVAGEGAVADGHSPKPVVDPAAGTGCGVVRENTFVDHQRTIVPDSAADAVHEVAGEGTVAEGQRALVGDAAARRNGGWPPAVDDRQARNGYANPRDD